ncbi:uncharacterized protein LOC101860473 [Aplysia californica]|uniref:Uncharacterized protein LOC101860473 n=1 Tax=Aplysia californica TaxID=6500 RepID=A0ABM0KB15_APLCA|nr:uncharacterized protein LOC101860473 [Aplysia californica]
MTSSVSEQAAPLISGEDLGIALIVTVVGLCGLFSLLGIVTNVTNLVVFAKLGFQDNINISLMGELITGLITAFITFERCLCIVLPLRVRTIISPGRTKRLVVSLFLLLFCLFLPCYYTNQLAWVFVPERNTSILKITRTPALEVVNQIISMTQGVLINTFSFVTVIICTTVLVVKLNKKTKWRKATAGKGSGGSGDLGLKEKKVAKTVTFIGAIFIVCSLYSTVVFFCLVIDTDLFVRGKNENLFLLANSISILLTTINSSVNMFVYLKMSSKYRAVFLQTFVWSD